MRLHAILAVSLALTLNAQDADAVIARNLQARGGAARLAAVKTLRLEGRVVSLADGVGTSWMEEDRLPRAWRSERGIDMGGRGIDVFDGVHGWHYNSREFNKEARPFSITEVEHFKVEERGWDLLLNYKTLELNAERLGRVREGGRLVDKVQIALSGGCRVIYSFDTTTGEETQRDQVWLEVGEEYRLRTTFDDYRKVGGIQLPYRIERQVLGHGSRERYTVERAVVNPPLADARFAMPGL